ncbi:MAG: hypothetical protein IKQ97_06960 [Eubacterium sp.]|nr:hypothetical protein [Eubacterium sp.]
MNEEMIVLEDVGAFMDWNRQSASSPLLKEKQAKLIFDQMERHEVTLLIDQYGGLYCLEKNGDMIGVQMDDLIDQACEWNYRDIRACKMQRMESSSFVNYCRYDDQLKELKKQERILNKLFDQTVYGRKISDRMRELAEKTWDDLRMVPIYDMPQFDDPGPATDKEREEEFHDIVGEIPFTDPVQMVSESGHRYVPEKGLVM